MLKNLMEDKRLDFNAPLMSVRRYHSSISSSATTAAAAKAGSGQKPAQPAMAAAADAAAAGPSDSSTSSLPFYKSDLKSGPVRNPGLVPFEWEQAPGFPKDGSLSGEQTVAAATSRPLSRTVETESSKLDVGIANVSVHPVKAQEKVEIAGIGVTIGKKSGEQKPIVTEEACGNRKGGGAASREETDDAFSDALDTLSHAESCFMNCSISGLTSLPDTAEPPPSGSCFSTDPHVRDFMMGRFLPAAQAMATSPSFAPSRRPAASAREATRRMENVGTRRPTPLPYQHQPKYPPLPQIVDGDSDDDDDYDETRIFPIKGCGFLPKFCLKAPFGVMNPIPGMRVSGRTPVRRPQFRSTIKQLPNKVSNVESKDETWEAVYRHKMCDMHQIIEEDRSKLTSESYQLTNWSDSQSADGSSPFRHSTESGISPYRNNAPPSPFHEGKGFLGFPKRDAKAVKSDSCDSGSGGIRSRSGSRSPAVEKTLYVDSVQVPETPTSNSSSANSKIFVNLDHNDSETAVGSGRIEETIISEDLVETKTPFDVLEIFKTELTFSADRSNSRERMNATKELDEVFHVDDSESLRPGHQSNGARNKLHALMPPPLPKSPTESWLWRTFPSASLKNPGSQSLLGIQRHSNKKAIQASTADSRQEHIITSNMHGSQMRFAEILAKPVNEN